MVRLRKATIEVARSATIITPWTLPGCHYPSPQIHTMPNPSLSIRVCRAGQQAAMSHVELLALSESA